MDIKFKKVDSSNCMDFVDSICYIHKKAYSKSHLTSSFSLSLLNSYYVSLINASKYSFVAIVNNNIEGFVISGDNFGPEMKIFQRKNFFKIIIFSFSRPLTFLNKTFYYLSTVFRILSKSKINTENKVKYRLFSIAVLPYTQSSGLGTKMISHLEKKLIEKDIYHYGLSVKRSDNRAINFYKRNLFYFEKSVEDNDFFAKKLEV